MYFRTHKNGLHLEVGDVKMPPFIFKLHPILIKKIKKGTLSS